jgi:hypothetical protein
VKAECIKVYSARPIIQQFLTTNLSHIHYLEPPDGAFNKPLSAGGRKRSQTLILAVLHAAAAAAAAAAVAVAAALRAAAEDTVAAAQTCSRRIDLAIKAVPFECLAELLPAVACRSSRSHSSRKFSNAG